MNKTKIQVHVADNISTDIDLTDAGTIYLHNKYKCCKIRQHNKEVFKRAKDNSNNKSNKYVPETEVRSSLLDKGKLLNDDWDNLLSMMDNEDVDVNEAISITKTSPNTKPSPKEVTNITTSNITTSRLTNQESKHDTITENTVRWTDTDSKNVELTSTSKSKMTTTEYLTAIQSKDILEQKRNTTDINKTKTKSNNSTTNNTMIQKQMQPKDIEKDRILTDKIKLNNLLSKNCGWLPPVPGTTRFTFNESCTDGYACQMSKCSYYHPRNWSHYPTDYNHRPADYLTIDNVKPITKTWVPSNYRLYNRLNVVYVNCWHGNHCELVIEGECSKLHPEELEAKAESLLRGSSSKVFFFTKNQALSCQKSRKTSTNTHVVL
jgi:hypothetical protein